MAKDTVAEIKERLSIQDIIAPYVKLRRAGRSLVGLCPFHKEKTGSFHVSQERGTWHCFGCGEGGDGFSFIEKMEGVDFKGALKILAEKAGVTIEYSRGGNREDTSKKDRLRALMSRAGEWYAGNLQGSPAEAYAKSRGLSDETSRNWRLGYAPEAWRTLLEALTAEGFSTAELLAAGLIKEADGKPGTYYDRFRNRLMFPIRDNAARVVAFTGRALPSTASAREGAVEVAKYLNSPETELYHKSEILFGMDMAKDAIRTRDYALLVEGQMDAILAHQAGFQNTIALSGTALSEKHLSTIQRFSENLKLVLDADRAGLSASDRSIKLALDAKMEVKAVGLPQGKDPADIISENDKKFAECIIAAKPVIKFFLEVLKQTVHNEQQLEREIKKMVFPIITSIRNPITADRAMQDIASVLGVSIEAVRESLAKLPRTNTKETLPPAGIVTEKKRSAREVREEMLLAVVHSYPETPLAKRIKIEYCRITEAVQLPQEALPEPVLFQAEQRFGGDPREDAADELLNAFEEAVIREAYQEAVTNLRRAEAAGDAALVRVAQAACAKLSARLAALGR